MHISAVCIRLQHRQQRLGGDVSLGDESRYASIVPCAGCKACDKPSVAVPCRIKCHTHLLADPCMDGQYEVHVPSTYLAYETRWLCLDIRIHCWPTHTHPADHPLAHQLPLPSLTLSQILQSRTQSPRPPSSASSLPPPAACRYLRVSVAGPCW